MPPGFTSPGFCLEKRKDKQNVFIDFLTLLKPSEEETGIQERWRAALAWALAMLVNV